jgi:hypothetical protein
VWWFDCEGMARRKQMAGRIVMLDAKLSANMLQLASVLPFQLSISDAACLALRLTDKHGRHTIFPLGLAMTGQQMRLPETFDSKKTLWTATYHKLPECLVLRCRDVLFLPRWTFHQVEQWFARYYETIWDVATPFSGTLLGYVAMCQEPPVSRW